MAGLGPLSLDFENNELLIDDYLTEGVKILEIFKRNLQKNLRWDLGHCSSRVLIEAVLIILICVNNQAWHAVKT